MSNRKVCCVNACKNKGGRMFRFPSPLHNSKRCQQWVEACKNRSLISVPMSRLRFKVICEKHFEKKYFLRKKLSSSAVPTLHLLGYQSKKEDKSLLIDSRVALVDHDYTTSGNEKNAEVRENMDVLPAKHATSWNHFHLHPKKKFKGNSC